VLPAVRNGERASISGGLLPGQFEAQSMHFHWGSPNTAGSEHAIDFERYDVEIHIVHKNTRYADMTVGEASEYWDGLAVLGIMLNGVNRPVQNTGLDRVFNQLPRIIRYQSNATIPGPITLRQLTGNVVTAQYFAYNGVYFNFTPIWIKLI